MTNFIFSRQIWKAIYKKYEKALYSAHSVIQASLEIRIIQSHD